MNDQEPSSGRSPAIPLRAHTLWRDPISDRYFLIPDRADLRKGQLELRTLFGRSSFFDIAEIGLFELTSSEASEWLKQKASDGLGNVLQQIATSLEQTDGSRSMPAPASKASPDEADVERTKGEPSATSSTPTDDREDGEEETAPDGSSTAEPESDRVETTADVDGLRVLAVLSERPIEELRGNPLASLAALKTAWQRLLRLYRVCARGNDEEFAAARQELAGLGTSLKAYGLEVGDKLDELALELRSNSETGEGPEEAMSRLADSIGGLREATAGVEDWLRAVAERVDGGRHGQRRDEEAESARRGEGGG
jgi:hypothetical protein